MSKRSRRTNRPPTAPRQSRGAPNEHAVVPSPQTLMRFMLNDRLTGEAMVEIAGRMNPALWRRDQRRLEQIENAVSVEELLDLINTSQGPAHLAWLKRVRAFGPEVAPQVAERLKNLPRPPLHRDRPGHQEKLIEALHCLGDAGLTALVDVWDDLNDYGRSIGCVVVGLQQARQEADRVWAFYEKVKGNQREHLLVGPLWALLDLDDQWAALALLELLLDGRDFYELFGFLARAGDRRAVVPLVTLSAEASARIPAEAMWALTSIAHRIDRAALCEELGGDTTQEDQADLPSAILVSC